MSRIENTTHCLLKWKDGKQVATCPYCHGDEPETIHHFLSWCNLFSDIATRMPGSIIEYSPTTTIEVRFNASWAPPANSSSSNHSQHLACVPIIFTTTSSSSGHRQHCQSFISLSTWLLLQAIWNQYLYGLQQDINTDITELSDNELLSIIPDLSHVAENERRILCT